MLSTSAVFRFLLIVGFIVFVSCNLSKHNEAGVQLAMKQYDHYIMNVDADSISLLFTPDGSLGDMAQGRDSIKKFLSSFKNVKVLSQISTTSSIKITADTAIQKGIYYQMDVISDKDTINVKGEYTATWEWISNEGWHIKRMATKPIK